jgi:hypothetical protein
MLRHAAGERGSERATPHLRRWLITYKQKVKNKNETTAAKGERHCVSAMAFVVVEGRISTADLWVMRSD